MASKHTEKSPDRAQEYTQKHELTKARRRYSKAPKGTEEHRAAEIVYRHLLTKYTEHLRNTKGVDAAEHVMFWEGKRIHWEKWGKTAVKTAGVLAAGALLAVGVYVPGGFEALAGTAADTISAYLVGHWAQIAMNVGISFGAGYLARLIVHAGFKFLGGPSLRELQVAYKAADEAQRNGQSHAEFRKTEHGKMISKSIAADKWGKGVGRIAGTAVGITSFFTFGHSLSQEMFNRLGIDHVSERTLQFIS